MNCESCGSRNVRDGSRLCNPCWLDDQEDQQADAFLDPMRLALWIVLLAAGLSIMLMLVLGPPR